MDNLDLDKTEIRLPLFTAALALLIQVFSEVFFVGMFVVTSALAHHHAHDTNVNSKYNFGCNRQVT